MDWSRHFFEGWGVPYTQHNSAESACSIDNDSNKTKRKVISIHIIIEI